MTLPLSPTIEPQLAKTATEFPAEGAWLYEPKWDGFRVIAFVDGDAVFLQSRNGKPLDRYFPELSLPPGRYVLDGEIVDRPRRRQPGFRRAAAAHPSRRLARRDAGARDARRQIVAFDLLADGDEVLDGAPVQRAPGGTRATPGRCRLASGDADAAGADGRGRAALARDRRGRDREAGRRPVPAGQAHGDVQAPAAADARLRDLRLPARQGAGLGGLADPRALRRGGQAPRRRPLLGVHAQGEARAARPRPALRDGPARFRGSRADGRPGATSSGSSCAPRWSSRCPTTT